VEHALSNNAIRDFPSTPAVSGFRNDVIRWPSRAAAGRSSLGRGARHVVSQVLSRPV
jgi:hypothetical protein